MVSGEASPERLVLGTAQWGMAYGVANRSGQPSREAVAGILRAAKEAGVRVIDTARDYGDSESVLGSLADQAAPFRIVTKLSSQLPVAGASADELRTAVRASVDQSLRALRRDRLDTLLLHRPEHRTVCDGAVWECLRALREQGLVRRLGMSSITSDDAEAALDDPGVEAIQVPTSLLDRRLVRRGFFERAQELDKEVFIRSVFLQGVCHIPPGELPSHLAPLQPALDQVRRWAEAHDATVAEVCLAYVRLLPEARVVIGCEERAQLEANLRAWTSSGPAAKIGELAESIPELDERLLDPWRWPQLAEQQT